MRRYRVGLFDQEAPGGEPAFDGVAQLWFQSDEEYRAKWRTYIDGTESVKDLMSQHVEENLRLTTREYVVLDGPREGLKITTVLRPTAGVSSESFYGYWFGTHAHKVKAAMERACGEGRCRYSISVGAHQATHPAQPQLAGAQA